jgi:FKBP-type peptidyl-prolyl cis-trans isomerase SlyD
MKEKQTVSKNTVITMQYSLTNSEGVVVREASDSPITYLHGSDALFGKLERELENQKVGDIVTARLLPEDAFGKRNIDLLCEVPLSEFPAGENIEVGGRVEGTDEDGEKITFTVTKLKDGTAHLDGNHPLAGQSLVFEVEIQAIRNASEEETRQGKVID